MLQFKRLKQIISALKDNAATYGTELTVVCKEFEHWESTRGASTCIFIWLNFSASKGFDSITEVLKFCASVLLSSATRLQLPWSSKICSASSFVEVNDPETFNGFNACTLFNIEKTGWKGIILINLFVLSEA